MTFQFFLYLKTDDSGINLDNDSRIFQWKMIFNSDPMKEYPEIIILTKLYFCIQGPTSLDSVLKPIVECKVSSNNRTIIKWSNLEWNNLLQNSY